MRFSCDAACGRLAIALRGSYGLFIGGSFVAGSSVFKTIRLSPRKFSPR